jgi:hypothetical protein
MPIQRWARFVLPLLIIVTSLAGPGLAHAGCSDTEPAALERVEGRLVGIASSIRAEPGRPPEPPAVSLLLETANGPLNVTLTDATTVSDADGRPIPPISIRPGTRLAVTGERTSPEHLVATSITVLP